MIAVHLDAPDDFEGWRTQARTLVLNGAAPAGIVWSAGEEAADLFGSAGPAAAEGASFHVPRSFVSLARTVICHNDPERFALLYSLLFRLRHNPRAIEDAADPLLIRLSNMARQVRRDMHKMRAFVRFRECTVDEDSRYVAWFEPEHHIVRANASFFVRRFAALRWSILTPEMSMHWDGERLCEGPPAERGDAPSADAFEEQWHAYYRSIFNPARLKVSAMLKEMPRKYWRNMPETALVPELIRAAQPNMIAMIEKDIGTVADRSLDEIEGEGRKCRRCPLYRPATQLVFGEGPRDARIMLVGEQPGDEEDRSGRPFVGPAGRLLDEALEEAGIDRSAVYVTNAVKHFKFVLRGKRRIHESPSTSEIDHCRWWLTQEIAAVRPEMIIALGASAARSVTGQKAPIKTLRQGVSVSMEGVETQVTVHPSYLLRIPDRERADIERAAFVADLRQAQLMTR